MSGPDGATHRILFFARAREIAGRDGLELPVEGVSRVEDVVDALTGRYPELGPYLRTCRFAVNQEFQSLDAALGAEGAEIAVIPPVSGGI